jgi:hypothetical protein
MGEEAITMPTTRSPNELVPLIKAAIRAGNESYLEAGRLLLEAKAALPHGSFQNWVEEHFDVSYRSAARYMRFAANMTTSASLADCERDPETRRIHRDVAEEFAEQEFADPEPEPEVGDGEPNFDEDDEPYIPPPPSGDDDWRHRVPRILGPGEYREAIIEMVEMGYRVLAKRDHPDAGGDAAKFIHLKNARDWALDYLQKL